MDGLFAKAVSKRRLDNYNYALKCCQCSSARNLFNASMAKDYGLKALSVSGETC